MGNNNHLVPNHLSASGGEIRNVTVTFNIRDAMTPNQIPVFSEKTGIFLK